MTVRGSIGLLAPAGTPVGIIEQVAQATRTAIAEPAYQQLLIDAGIEATLDSNPEKFRQSLAADIALWAPIVKALELKIDYNVGHIPEIPFSGFANEYRKGSISSF